MKNEFAIDDAAIRTIIRSYTREAGVRNLEREMATLSRKVIKELLTSDVKAVKVTAENLEKYLGVIRYRFGEIEGEDQVGVVTGLEWTEFGGELLTVEGVMMPARQMTVTGNLREVMKESISAAASYVRFAPVDFGIKPPLLKKRVARACAGGASEGWTVGRIAMVTASPVMTGIGQEGRRHDGEITCRAGC